ncbi:CoA transferase [Streptomyces sp. NPDC086787]|uniref:CoA transferase n=1 Tax=Streptomyces sp. NPDC086787 TaxID=3365759 RepID=UPI00381AA1D9
MTVESVFTGLKVLDASSSIAGPAAATVLSDFGADVIKIEPPGMGDPQRRLSSVPRSWPVRSPAARRSSCTTGRRWRTR